MMKKILLYSVLPLFVLNLSAQVTIGSGVPPIKGALLQIAEQVPDENNVTCTNGGLLLPRVELISRTSLQPLLADTVGQNKIHAGLIVYNLKKTDSLDEGILCWNGQEWVNNGVFKKLLFETRSAKVTGYGVGTTGGTFDKSEPFPNYSFVIPAGMLKENSGYINFFFRAYRSFGAGVWHVGFKISIGGVQQNIYFARWNSVPGVLMKNGRIFYNGGKIVMETTDKDYTDIIIYDATKDVIITLYGGTDDLITTEMMNYAIFEWIP